MNACIDSDVLIDYFAGVEAAAVEFGRYERIFFSRITWMEVLVGVSDPELKDIRKNFMAARGVVELDEAIAAESIRLREGHRMKLPDAIIWATARSRNALVVTRNEKDFPGGDPGVRIPYRI